jgi:hypothetical protein
MLRLALHAHEYDKQPQDTLLNLLDGIDGVGLHENDGLCCGTAGSIDLLLSVGRELPQPYYTDRAHYWLRQMIQRAYDRGGYVTAQNIPDCMNNRRCSEALQDYTIKLPVAPTRAYSRRCSSIPCHANKV